MKNRGFEKITEYAEDAGVKIPIRGTEKSAGYDLSATKDVVIHPNEMVLVPTGLKAYMKKDEFLALYIRSSIAVKHNVGLANSVAVIDGDYYNNPDNEGHILLPLYNYSKKAFAIKKGERVAQGVFHKYLTVDGDDAKGSRKGGIGSTGKS